MLIFKAHRLLYHSTLGSRVIKKVLLSATAVRKFACGSAVRYDFIPASIPEEYEFGVS